MGRRRGRQALANETDLVHEAAVFERTRLLRDALHLVLDELCAACGPLFDFVLWRVVCPAWRYGFAPELVFCADERREGVEERPESVNAMARSTRVHICMRDMLLTSPQADTEGGRKS